jgi:hypothetical protein
MRWLWQRTTPSVFKPNPFAISAGNAVCIFLLLLPCISRAATPPDRKTKAPAIRWNEQLPGCTFSQSDDGKFHYGLWSADIGLTLSVDSQELQKVRFRHEPFFSALVEIRYRGQKTLAVDAGAVSLEFVSHFKVVQTALDPDDFAQKIQNDADAVDHEAAREAEKHPEKKDAKEASVRTFQKNTAELLEFVSKDSLRTAQLDGANAETSGWVLFSTESRWISGWKKQEEFILRIPLDGKVFEFPFKLPPKPGEILLRKRE